MRYGNFDLQRDDHDGVVRDNRPPRWGGLVDPPSYPATGETPQDQGGATLVVPQYVQQLQRDLRSLGFGVVGVPSGYFDRYTEWAVREFQIYAGMSHVAQFSAARLRSLLPASQLGTPLAEHAHDVALLGVHEGSSPAESIYAATLSRIPNTCRYAGPISGIVDQKTRDAVEHWIHNNYRCPVIVEAWTVDARTLARTRPFVNGINIWRHDEITHVGVKSGPRWKTHTRMFFRDFTRYYCYPSTQRDDHYQPLGSYTNYKGYGGPVSTVPAHCWPESEMTPERLIEGRTLAALQADPRCATASTYRVVRATAEQECLAAFDSVNAYDDALVSIGPCHWTLGVLPAKGYHNGELAGFLAYVLHHHRSDYLTAFGNFGLYPSAAWVRSNQGALWNAGQRKYAGWIRQHAPVTSPAEAPDNLGRLPEVSRQLPEANYYKTWHWFYRWVMAGRCVPGVRSSMWDMVRLRLRAILAIPVLARAGNQRIAGSLGTVFTSEKAIAILLRWHIFRPAHVAGNAVGDSMHKAILANPSIDWALPLNRWTDLHEQALSRQLLTDATAITSSQKDLASWPAYAGREIRKYSLNHELGPLSEARHSFVLDTTGL